MRERVNFNFRIKPELKKLFKQAVITKGFSTCFILETLIQAWIAGAPADPKAHPGASIIINQKIDYNVKKSRRTRGGPPDNCYAKPGVWIYKKPDSKEDLNAVGHHISCLCLSCNPSGKL